MGLSKSKKRNTKTFRKLKATVPKDNTAVQVIVVRVNKSLDLLKGKPLNSKSERAKRMFSDYRKKQ